MVAGLLPSSQQGYEMEQFSDQVESSEYSVMSNRYRKILFCKLKSKKPLLSLMWADLSSCSWGGMECWEQLDVGKVGEVKWRKRNWTSQVSDSILYPEKVEREDKGGGMHLITLMLQSMILPKRWSQLLCNFLEAPACMLKYPAWKTKGIRNVFRRHHLCFRKGK